MAAATADATYIGDVFALSSLTAGAPALDSVTTLVAPGSAPALVALQISVVGVVASMPCP